MNKHQTIVTLLSHEWVLRQQIYDPERWPLSVGYRANISWGWRYAVAENFRINMELARRSFGRVSTEWKRCHIAIHNYQIYTALWCNGNFRYYRIKMRKVQGSIQGLAAFALVLRAWHVVPNWESGTC